MQYLSRALRILLWIGVIVFVLLGAGLGASMGGVVTFVVGTVAGFFVAAIIFGTLALLFEIRDILEDIRKGARSSPAVPTHPTSTLATVPSMARDGTSGG